MMDNQTFFVGQGVEPEEVRLAFLKVFNLRSRDLVFTDKGDWAGSIDPMQCTVVSWHRYAHGDLRVEFFVVLGGKHLGVEDVRRDAWFPLSKELETEVFATRFEPVVEEYSPTGEMKLVAFSFPEERGREGPIEDCLFDIEGFLSRVEPA